MLTWINAGCDVGLGLPKCQAMHPTSVLGQTRAEWSVSCRQETHALRHNPLFDHLVGAGEQCLGDIQTQRLDRL